MRILSVVGARPQFIKAASVCRELRKFHDEILVHTGQHYDENMSDIFFSELDIPKPKYNLGVGSNTHAKQTAEIMSKLEDVLFAEKPDAVLIYGDTNSTLAAAITAGKLNVPIAHVEAGARTGVMDMPEEQNRIVADHLSYWNFAASKEHLDYLNRENITHNAYNVGDVMLDGLIYYSKKIENMHNSYFINNLEYYIQNDKELTEWYLVTLHRPENVDDPQKMKSILGGLEKLDKQVVFAVHPRTYNNAKALIEKNDYRNIHFVKPMGYLTAIFFAKNAKKIITDSGGLHKEAFLMRVPAVVILRGSGWCETFNGNCNIKAKPDGNDILDKLYNTIIDYSFYENEYYGNGTASVQIANILRNY